VLPSSSPTCCNGSPALPGYGHQSSAPQPHRGDQRDYRVFITRRRLRELLCHYPPGPDFPTAGFIYGREAGGYGRRTEGRGIRADAGQGVIETQKKSSGRSIIVTEIPYQVNKAKLIERLGTVKERRSRDLRLRDESDREGCGCHRAEKEKSRGSI